MRFMVIDPTARLFGPVEADSPHKASPKLSISNVDHGTVAPGIGIIVYEYGLLEGEGPYFALGGQLFAGEAVLYAYDEAGETIDFPDVQLVPPLWLATKADVEAAIKDRTVQRPYSAVNREIIWQWS